MKELLSHLQSLKEFQEITKALQKKLSPIAFSGLSLIHRSIALAVLSQTAPCSVVIVPDEEEGKALQGDLQSLLGRNIPLLPSRPFSFYGDGSHQWEQERIRVLSQVHHTPLIIATIEGVLQRTLPPAVLENNSFTLKVGEDIPLESLSMRLVQSGYLPCEMVEGVGQFSIRGGIVDVFSPNCNQPVRLDFFGETIDCMGSFQVDSQRRTENLQELLLLPVTEILPHSCPELLTTMEKALKALRPSKKTELWQETLTADIEAMKTGTLKAPERYLQWMYPEFCTFLDYLPKNALVFFSDSSKITERGKSWQWHMEEDGMALLERGKICSELCHYALNYPQFLSRAKVFPWVYLDAFTLSTYPVPPKSLQSLVAKQISPFVGNLLVAKEDIQSFHQENARIVVLLSNQQRCESFYHSLEKEGISATLDSKLQQLPEASHLRIGEGILTAGFQLGDLVVLVEGSGSPMKQRKAKSASSNREKVKNYADLAVGDLVVHETYGIGRYQGMEKIQVDGIWKDYINILYAEADQLCVPATQLDSISKYIGGGEDSYANKKLSKLGGNSWEKSKRQAKKAVADLAKGLIQLYAQRNKLQGFAFSPDVPCQGEFEEEFPYVETDDQLRSVQEIKRDMENSRPMDRLLCGDVGYGKTEVAFRAMMKCIQDGKQTAILVPTTVLARQHHLTALKRFASYPVKIDMVNRFRTGAQMKETLRKVASGEIDILIGTHRLFQKDVIFQDLGLLVVDEEQRFGVSHKEKLKERFSQVDVLTLSATPIPRTLNMALSGIRDMSTLEEPPANRLPVQTYVLEENWAVLKDAMERELQRGGQVFFLHNRIDGIEATARQLQQLLGEQAQIAVAHGRMGQDEINEVMGDMTDGRVNVLLCTTIIETGIDLPNANTLIIQDADKLGLAQLHQIRGRVGRSNRRAYAYLTYREGKILSEVANKRLMALREFAEFGSGFKIAMRDLEIRGAGNVLGPEQSGFMLSVGYDMYLKLLEEAVLTEQGLPLPQSNNCLADLTVSASVPDRYVPEERQRMDLYRRIVRLRTEEDADDLVDELIDRYGEPPRTVNNLISVALLRAMGAQYSVTNIQQRGEKLHWHFSEIDFEVVSTLCNLPRYQKKLVFVPGDTPQLAQTLPPKGDVLAVARVFLEDFHKLSQARESVPISPKK